MAVGEPAVHLPGCNKPWSMVDESPKDRAAGSFQMAIFLAYKWGAQWLTIDQLGWSSKVGRDSLLKTLLNH